MKVAEEPKMRRSNRTFCLGLLPLKKQRKKEKPVDSDTLDRQTMNPIPSGIEG
jgi:hypothetical protein